MTASAMHRNERWWRIALTILVVVTCLRVWIADLRFSEPAHAQIPDAGAQRMALVQELRRTNARLTEVVELLKTHTFTVRVENADKPKRAGTLRPPNLPDRAENGG